MVACKHCDTTNSLDSLFCKHCGAALPDNDVLVGRERLQSLIAEGYSAFNQNRTAEAMMIALTAVASDPGSSSALSLKGMCHERQGELAEALECYEKIVSINPDSALDKIKVNQLRNLLAGRPADMTPANRRLAYLGAAAAVVLVLAIGSGVAVATSARVPDQVAFQPVEDTALNQMSPFEPTAETAPQRVTGGTATGESTNEPAGANGSRDLGANGTPLTGRTIPSIETPGAETVRPVNPFPSGKIEVLPEPSQTIANVTPSETSRPDPDPEPQAVTPTEATAPDRSKDPGEILIKVSSPKSRNVGGSEDAGANRNGLEALVRTARSYFQVGNYSAAANSYERALRSGGDAASINQRLGQCYEKLGRGSEAISAYTKAAAAYEANLKTGVGDKDRDEIALAACRQALKVLQGG